MNRLEIMYLMDIYEWVVNKTSCSIAGSYHFQKLLMSLYKLKLCTYVSEP
jgi:hypothetical protein